MRYIVHEKQLFFGLSEWLVIDTTMQALAFSKLPGHAICACDTQQDAEKIADALNAYGMQ